jgi:hypothetical protein
MSEKKEIVLKNTYNPNYHARWLSYSWDYKWLEIFNDENSLITKTEKEISGRKISFFGGYEDHWLKLATLEKVEDYKVSKNYENMSGVICIFIEFLRRNTGIKIEDLISFLKSEKKVKYASYAHEIKANAVSALNYFNKCFSTNFHIVYVKYDDEKSSKPSWIERKEINNDAIILKLNFNSWFYLTLGIFHDSYIETPVNSLESDALLAAKIQDESDAEYMNFLRRLEDQEL